MTLLNTLRTAAHPCCLAVWIVLACSRCSHGEETSVPNTLAVANKPLHFANDIEPLLSRYGCNAGGCHGKASGQNGFKLSLFGFDPAFDYNALVKEARGRRVFPAAPDPSLLLRKATAHLPHGGGRRF